VASPGGVRPPKPLVRPGNRVLGGVLAGFADYLGVDVVPLRIVYALVTLFTGIIPGVVAYIIAWIIMPQSATGAVPAATQAAAPARRLYRSRTNRKLGGVCAGIGEYAGMDVTLVRLLWAVLTVIPGAIVMGMVAYLVCWIVIPEAPEMLPAAASATPQHS
jgi:phage shock protein PspC (stress-responsive transcriptional regulator)